MYCNEPDISIPLTTPKQLTTDINSIIERCLSVHRQLNYNNRVIEGVPYH